MEKFCTVRSLVIIIANLLESVNETIVFVAILFAQNFLKCFFWTLELFTVVNCCFWPDCLWRQYKCCHRNWVVWYHQAIYINLQLNRSHRHKFVIDSFFDSKYLTKEIKWKVKKTVFNDQKRNWGFNVSIKYRPLSTHLLWKPRQINITYIFAWIKVQFWVTATFRIFHIFSKTSMIEFAIVILFYFLFWCTI